MGKYEMSSFHHVAAEEKVHAVTWAVSRLAILGAAWLTVSLLIVEYLHP